MRYSPWFGTIVLSVTLLAPLGSLGRAYGLNYGGDIVTVTPVETVYEVPSSSLVSTSYLLPTTYTPTVYTSSLLPTTYTLSSTAYIVPSYASTTYVSRRGLLGRSAYTTTSYNYLPTTYLSPSSYVLPTTYTYIPTVLAQPVVTTALTGCEGVAPAVVRPAPVQAPRDTRGQQTYQNERPPREVESSTVGEPPASYSTEPNPVEKATAATAEPRTAPKAPAPPENRDGSPTPPTSPQPAVPGKPKQAEAAPPANDEQQPLPLPLPPEEVRHEARKPVSPLPARGRENILSGVVRSYETGGGVEGVRVTLSNRLQTFMDRWEETDALGRFAIRVPDGDWLVKVQSNSGRTYVVKNITVSGGSITDDLGQKIPSLIIRR